MAAFGTRVVSDIRYEESDRSLEDVRIEYFYTGVSENGVLFADRYPVSRIEAFFTNLQQCLDYVAIEGFIQKIHTVQFIGLGLTTNDLIRVFSMLPIALLRRIHTLYLGENQLTDLSVHAICNNVNLCLTLENLHMGHNKLKDGALYFIAQAHVEGRLCLRELTIRSNQGVFGLEKLWLSFLSLPCNCLYSLNVIDCSRYALVASLEMLLTNDKMVSFLSDEWTRPSCVGYLKSFLKNNCRLMFLTENLTMVRRMPYLNASQAMDFEVCEAFLRGPRRLLSFHAGRYEDSGMAMFTSCAFRKLAMSFIVCSSSFEVRLPPEVLLQILSFLFPDIVTLRPRLQVADWMLKWQDPVLCMNEIVSYRPF